MTSTQFRPAFVFALSLTPLATWAGGIPVTSLDTVEVIGQKSLQDASTSSTQGYVTKDQLAERPISRSGELLEFVPGMIVTQHSGEGKANQYFLRGFNLDHGTDFYTEVDGLPVNMRTHGHGQGYADINFIIPELIDSLEYRKGPYYADVGDFAAAGAASLRYVDELPQSIAKFSTGSDGYYNGLFATSPKVGNGHLLLGIEGTAYNGAYDLAEHERKLAAIARYNSGTVSDGYTLSLATYGINYNAPDQVPLRAVQSGQIGRLGFIDPSDGGNVRRHSLNAEWRGSDGTGNWRVQGYGLYYKMALFSNFTYFLDDPVNGDQFEQADDRRVFGVNAKRYWRLPTQIPIDIELGLQSRYDDIMGVGLYRTKERQRLSTVREDNVKEFSISPYLSSTQKWTHYFRSQIGLRLDRYSFDVNSDRPENSGTRQATIASPKVALIFGPFEKTELYLNYGNGFHSNDARGVTLKVDPNDGTPLPGAAVPPLVKARGGEFGVTSWIIPKVKLTASLWTLHLDSELVYGGDSGVSDPSGASRRFGQELSIYYTPLSWLVIDGDVAFTRARIDSPDGNRIPNAIENVVAMGLTIPETNGWSGGLRLRRLGPAPLIENNSQRSRTTTVLNAQAGYRFSPSYTATLSVLNLLNSKDNDITYYYTSRLPGEPAQGVDDIHNHPVEPRALRLSLRAEF
ncbi:MAG: TonB-dependent receptor [Pseudomonadota bacterium]